MRMILLTMLLALASACGQPSPPAATAPAPTNQNLDPENPETGENNHRPDSIKDVQPEPR